MREDHCPDLLFGHGLLVPTNIEAALVDLTGNLLRLHTMARIGKKVYYGFGEFHLQAMSITTKIYHLGIHYAFLFCEIPEITSLCCQNQNSKGAMDTSDAFSRFSI